MPRAICQLGGAADFAGVPALLAGDGFAMAAAPPAEMLVLHGGDADAVAREATSFAGAAAPGGLVVFLLPRGSGDWVAARHAALVWAFTRHAALTWAARDVRVNAVALGEAPALPSQPAESAAQAAGPAPAVAASQADIAGAVMMLWRCRSMTGQLVRLG